MATSSWRTVGLNEIIEGVKKDDLLIALRYGIDIKTGKLYLTEVEKEALPRNRFASPVT